MRNIFVIVCPNVHAHMLTHIHTHTYISINIYVCIFIHKQIHTDYLFLLLNLRWEKFANLYSSFSSGWIINVF